MYTGREPPNFTITFFMFQEVPGHSEVLPWLMAYSLFKKLHRNCTMFIFKVVSILIVQESDGD